MSAPCATVRGMPRSYTRSERHQFRPPPCERCGETDNFAVNWENSSNQSSWLARGAEVFTPTGWTCLTCHPDA